MFDLKSAQLLFEAAEELHLQPRWLTDYGLFSIQVGNHLEYIFYSTSVLNTHLASYLAKNKHVTRTILSEKGFLNIPYALPKNLAEATAFLTEHKVIIAKPTLGKHSQDIHLIDSVAKLAELDLSQYLLEKYIPGKEYRYLILQDEVIAVHHKKYEPPINNPEKLERISLDRSTWNPALIKTALQIAQTLNLQLAAVDFMIDAAGRPFVLEVNSSPGITRFHYPNEGPAINLATLFLEATVKELRRLQQTKSDNK